MTEKPVEIPSLDAPTMLALLRHWQGTFENVVKMLPDPPYQFRDAAYDFGVAANALEALMEKQAPQERKDGK